MNHGAWRVLAFPMFFWILNWHWGHARVKARTMVGRSKHQMKQTNHVTRNLAVVQVFEMPKRIQISTPIPHVRSSKDLAQLKPFRNSTLEVPKRMVYQQLHSDIVVSHHMKTPLFCGLNPGLDVPCRGPLVMPGAMDWYRQAFICF